jgi:hypothetical protein
MTLCTREAILRACDSSDPEEIRKVQKICKVTADKNFIDVWPFNQIRLKQRTCDKLLRLDNKVLLKQTLDEQTLQRLLSVSKQPYTAVTNYKGYIEHGIFALLFLLKRNHNECVVITNIERTMRRIIQYPDITLERLDWSDIGIYWRDGVMTVPGKQLRAFVESSQQCLQKPTTRFFLCLITLVSKDQIHHANILLYDKMTGLLERFDSYQTQLETSFHTKQLDENLDALFRQIAPTEYQRFLKPIRLSLRVRNGLQYKAELENQQTPNDPIGFCQPWTVLYADARLSLPNQDPSSIPELIEMIADSEHLSLTEFIRNYAQHLQEIQQRIYLNYWLKHPEYQKYKDPRIPMYALFLEELVEYASVYT